MRIFLNFLLAWIFVSAAILAFKHATKKERITTAKAIIFGLVTAAITTFILFAIVAIF